MRLKGKKPIFNDEDTYSMDNTLRPIIAEGLKKFLEVLKKQDSDPENGSFGIPADFVGGSSGDDDYDDKTEQGTKDWFLVLDKMIYAFDTSEPELRDGVLEMTIPYPLREEEPLEANINVLDQVAYDEHKKECASWEKNKKEGLSLFAMYYDNLWW